jgi:exopolysaccharide biosynthesis WecB/TagA/CpsF family protein
MEYIEILGVPVVNSNFDDMNQELMNVLDRDFDRCHPVYFLNAHGGNLTFTDPKFAKALKEATYVLNDGIGVDMAAWMKGKKFIANLNGSDLIDEGEFLRMCAERNTPVYILGAKQEVLDLAVKNYKENYPGLNVCGSHHGYFDHYGDDESMPVVEDINNSGAEVLLVGFGNPRQEHWIEAYREHLKCKLAFGFGGSIDQVAKVVPRAPKFWIAIRMEWFFRLCQEPQRLWRRYLIGNVTFLWRALTRQVGLYKTA